MDIFLSRQPVFDRTESIAGYALSYRGHPRPAKDSGPEDDTSERLLVDAFLGIGLDHVTDGRVAFFKATREMLVGGAIDLLDPRRIIIELPANRWPDPEVAIACNRLASEGYRFALDGIAVTGQAESLLRMAEIVRIDVHALATPTLSELIYRLKPYDVRLLAQNVENRIVRDACLELGFELFQGFDASRPEILVQRDIPIDHLRTFRLMRQIRDLDVTDAELEDAFRSDVSLSYKLLRMVNSAASGTRGVASIGHAIRLLGRDALYRWLALLLLSSVSDGELQAEIIRTALLRARLCELLAARTGDPASSGPLFMVGLLSVLDVLLATPLDVLVAEMDLALPIKEALLNRSGAYGAMLQLVEAYERGDWDRVLDRCGELGLAAHALTRDYLEALAWANERMNVEVCV
ncbi:MAG TPA: HDOD domain-containing protein [Longimicrobiales bacterium]